MGTYRAKSQYVDAVQLTADAEFTIGENKVKAEKGDWLVTMGEDQKIVKNATFFRLYEPITPAEHRRLYAEGELKNPPATDYDNDDNEDLGEDLKEAVLPQE